MHVIAVIHSGFTGKFGIPRQSGLVPSARAEIVFEPAYRNADALRGLEDFSHLWLIWEFSMAKREDWSPTVRPPRLGGNKRMGVFATRSPNRPNPIGLTRVRLLNVEWNTPQGPVMTVGGADLMDGTVILDIKPYLPYADSVPDAAAGEYGPQFQELLDVEIPDEVAALYTSEQSEALKEALSFDPRPGYQSDSDRVYGFRYGDYDIRFRVIDKKAIVTKAVPLSK